MTPEALKSVSIGRAIDRRRLELIVNPTEKCNFRCVYCYEDFKIGRMKPEIVDALKRFLDSQAPRLRWLDLGFFGGEPLLGKAQVIEIAGHAAALARSHKGGLTYHGSMTTNGYLLDLDTARQLSDVGVRSYQISLDGYGATHDETRRRADGGGTFERIWGNLVALGGSDLKFHIVLRVHHHPGNIDAIGTLLGKIDAAFGDDPRFSIFLKPIGHYGGPNDPNFKVFDEAGQQAAESQLRSLSPRLDFEGDGQDQPPYICYAAKPNSLLVRADGSLAKCTVALNDDRNAVGRLLPNGRLSIDKVKMRAWTKGLATRDFEVLGCPLPHLVAEGLGTLA